jgi:predicted permease
MLNVFVNVLLPVFLIMGVGFLLDRLLALQAQTISRVILYGFSPALVFTLLSTSAMKGGDAFSIGVFVMLNTLIMALLGWSLSRALRFNHCRETAFLLTICFVNAGNYGLPVTLFAFGQEGMERAAVYFVFSSLFTNTLGVYIASRGKNGSTAALLAILKMPIAWAAVLGFAVNALGWTAPEPLFKALELLGRAAVPGMLILLGIQLSRTHLAGQAADIALATIMRIGIAPLIALPMAYLTGLTGVTRQACILEASTPTAVMTSILSLEFQADSAFVAGVIFTSTLASVLSLTLLISFLR